MEERASSAPKHQRQRIPLVTASPWWSGAGGMFTGNASSRHRPDAKPPGVFLYPFKLMGIPSKSIGFPAHGSTHARTPLDNAGPSAPASVRESHAANSTPRALPALPFLTTAEGRSSTRNAMPPAAPPRPLPAAVRADDVFAPERGPLGARRPDAPARAPAERRGPVRLGTLRLCAGQARQVLRAPRTFVGNFKLSVRVMDNLRRYCTRRAEFSRPPSGPPVGAAAVGLAWAAGLGFSKPIGNSGWPLLHLSELLDGDVRRLRDQPERQRTMRLDAPRATLAAHSPRAGIALQPRPPAPAADARRTHTEPAAAARWLNPAATAATTRTRRSRESALDMSTGLLPGRQPQPRIATPREITIDSTR